MKKLEMEKINEQHYGWRRSSTRGTRRLRQELGAGAERERIGDPAIKKLEARGQVGTLGVLE